MSTPANDPGTPGGNATEHVAAILTARAALPPIEPFTADAPALAGLPAFTPVPAPVPEPASRASVARGVYDAAITALAALKRLEDATAATKAALVDRLLGAAAVEAAALALDPWQTGKAEASAKAELALTLAIPARTAAALADRARELIQDHPGARAALAAGELSWRHAVTILEETATLTETPATTTADRQVFEARLLRLAPGTTAAVFAAQARRLREGTHPETLPARTRRAYLTRDMTLEPGHDGMSWLTLHLPAPAAEGIWVHCTRTARSLQGAHENRTLTQLRLDTATTLLLGHHPLSTTATTPAGDAADDRSGTTGNAGGGRTVPTAGTAGGTVTVLAGTAGGTVTVVDGEPPWAHTGARRAVPGEDTPATVATAGPAAAASAARADRSGGAAAGAVGAAEADRSGGDDRAGAPIAGVLCGDGSGYVDGLVDGIPEEPLREYLEQLEKVRTGMAVTEPPLPTAQILVTVPLLGLVGATNQPAELAGYGPIPETLARTLLANAATFLRVATDPLTDEPLNLAPTRYRLRAAERALLRAMAGSCYWPNCTNPVLDTENDHLTAWEHGGRSTPANQRPACTLHHALRHFKDDKDRHGRPRRQQDPARTGIKLRGWTPRLTPDGRVGWKAPSGRYHPPHAPGHPATGLPQTGQKIPHPRPQPPTGRHPANQTTGTNHPAKLPRRTPHRIPATPHSLTHRAPHPSPRRPGSQAAQRPGGPEARRHSASPSRTRWPRSAPRRRPTAARR